MERWSCHFIKFGRKWILIKNRLINSYHFSGENKYIKHYFDEYNSDTLVSLDYTSNICAPKWTLYYFAQKNGNIVRIVEQFDKISVSENNTGLNIVDIKHSGRLGILDSKGDVYLSETDGPKIIASGLKIVKLMKLADYEYNSYFLDTAFCMLSKNGTVYTYRKKKLHKVNIKNKIVDIFSHRYSDPFIVFLSENSQMILYQYFTHEITFENEIKDINLFQYEATKKINEILMDSYIGALNSDQENNIMPRQNISDLHLNKMGEYGKLFTHYKIPNIVIIKPNNSVLFTKCLCSSDTCYCLIMMHNEPMEYYGNDIPSLKIFCRDYINKNNIVDKNNLLVIDCKKILSKNCVSSLIVK